MSSSNRCQARGGAAACTDPNCPERRGFVDGGVAQRVERQVHTSVLPSGLYEASLLDDIPVALRGGRDFVREPLDDGVVGLVRTGAQVPDDLSVGSTVEVLDGERTAVTLPSSSTVSCDYCGKTATLRVDYHEDDWLAEALHGPRVESSNVCEYHKYTAFS